MGFDFTPGQRRAIGSRGSSLLVSAAAGSGKTRVLTERVMSYVTDPDEPRDIDSFLIITYTRAAAAELRSRIIGQLGKLAAENPTNARLRRQQNLCYRAQIGTIHSFCTDILRENCHHLGLSPAFRVMEEDKASAMQRSVLEKLLDVRYEHLDAHPGFRLLADTVGAGRDDSRLADVVLRLYGKLRSHPYPEVWAQEKMKALEMEDITDVGESIWGREILSTLADSALFWQRRMDAAVEEIYAADDKIQKAYGDSFAESAQALGDFSRALRDGWDRARSFLPIPFPRLGGLRNYENPQLSEKLKAVRESCKKAAQGWVDTLAGESDTLIADMRAMAPAAKALLELTLELDHAFSAQKRRQSYLDFSDLEHLSAQLLVDRESGAPTWIAVEISQRYTEIMVDEYQDVNAVQEMIFTAVSRSGRNLFMVGDVKQSIYRFRLADLSIFLDKFQRFSDTPDPDAPGERILLRENFRSRKSVLYAANHVFSNIMSHELGEIDYDESAVLIYGATGYPDGEEASAELDIIDPEGGSDDEEAPERLEQEARFVAGKIRELVDSAVPVYENGVPRPCTWGDFAVLLRSPSGSGAIFHRVLTGEGIPVQSRQGLGFFTSLEVTVAINMLSLIDNPHADVPLISVLRSPAFAFDADELSSIRGCDRTGDYYSALCAAAEGGDEKCRAFLLTLNRLRAAAPDMELGELLWRVYTETDLFALCLAMTDGETRRGNLMRLFEYARSFESGGGNGVFAFVSWLRRLEERGEEPEIAPEGDAVRIMSIHKSKGLEFPFVFLSDLSHRFNKRDMTSPVLLHTDLGLGLKMTDTARGIEYPTLARRAVESRMLREMLSEEMRVLYVGMTRAKERLFMTCTIKNAEKAISALAQDLTSPIPPERLLTASSFAQWLIQCALLDEGELIKLNIALPGHGGQIQDSAADEAAGEDDACYQLLKSRLDFAYPYADASRLPSKLTATGLKGRVGEAEITGEAQEISPPPVEYSFRRAELGSGERLDAAERGTATHMLLQYMDLHATATRESILGELQRLTASGHLTAEQAKAVNVGAIMRFGASPLCRRIMSADEVHREFRFTLLSSAGDYFDAADGEQLLLQGVVDCFIVENGKITVIDYKTDRVTQEEVPGRAEHYAPQVRAYARALERICKLPVAQCLVYFLSIGECCTVEI